MRPSSALLVGVVKLLVGAPGLARSLRIAAIGVGRGANARHVNKTPSPTPAPKTSITTAFTIRLR